MNLEYNQNYKKDVLRLALFIGELMLANGAETYRVEDSILRICRSRGFKHINVFTSPTVIIISDERFDGLSFMKTLKSRSMNLNKIALLNNFSREFVNNPDLSIDDAIKELKDISNLKPYPQWFIYGSTGIASASFGCLLGATHVLDFIFTFIIAILAVIIFDKTMKISSIPAFSSLVSSFFIAVFGVLLAEFNILDTPKMLIVGSIMPLLPGVSFIKGLRDLISGDLIAGVALAFDAGMTAVAIASGVGFVLDLWYRFIV
ncbi:threonine/serine exporter [Romboutsia maritimum]|uniref:Threonine/serine exporter n=1 Tax=Romboutsia maritimum TaxID=2020948 RepID=A0A371IRB9_9FIRM|nr:threonine/serine exporter family protein [Romboutsia maritimum]RDY23027.1 threonine/serine exporter [Romboutsia maritimum]